MTTTSLAPRIVSVDAATRAMYVANCRICTLAENMRVCPACKFRVGLIAKLMDREHKPAEQPEDYRRLAMAIEAEPDITDAVNFTDELTAIEKLQREIEQIADKFGTGSAGSALYGDWSEPSDAYKAAQPYHNDLYPY